MMKSFKMAIKLQKHQNDFFINGACPSISIMKNERTDTFRFDPVTLSGIPTCSPKKYNDNLNA